MSGGLYVDGDQSGATGLTSVASGATLGGAGIIGGGAVIADGATLSPGDVGTAPGTLGINGNLTLGSGSLLAYSFGQANVVGGPFNDLTRVQGNLVLDGTLNIQTTAEGSFDPGIYRVISYAGSLTDNGLAIGSIPSPGFSVQTSMDHQVNLVNSANTTLNFWDGAAGPKIDGVINGGDGVWRNSAGNNNWTNELGAPNTPFANGAFAIFTATPGTVTVDNSLGGVSASGMQFASNGYVVQGGDIALVGPQSIIRVGDGTADGAGYTATITSNLTGSTQLVKTDIGTLVLDGTNSYTGGTAINGGTLRIAADANLGAAAGGLSFNGGTLNTTADMSSARTVTLDGAGTISPNGGTLLNLSGPISGAGSLTKDGAGVLVIASNAAYTGGTTIAAGTLQLGNGGTAGSVIGDVLNDGLLAFNRSDDITFAGVISGIGSVSQLGTGTTTLPGASSYSGATDIVNGTLAVNGSIASSAVTVHNGAILAGTGTVGSTTVASGGTIAPGGAIGTLSVIGGYSQAGGATYQVQLDPTSTGADLIAVTGTATLAPGAIVNVAKTVGSPYRLGMRYTILTTTAGLGGTFDVAGDTALSPFIALRDIYDSNNAYLVVERTHPLGPAGNTPNQVATGNGLDSLPPDNPLLAAVLNSPSEDAARQALDQLSGEIHSSAKTATIEDSHFVRDAATDRIREAFCGVAAQKTEHTGNEPALVANKRPASDCDNNSDRLTAWGQAFGSWGHTDGDGNAARLSRSIGGFFLGVDAPVFKDWRVGMLGGYSRSNFHVKGRGSSGTSDDYHVGIYGGTQWGGARPADGGHLYLA